MSYVTAGSGEDVSDAMEGRYFTYHKEAASKEHSISKWWEAGPITTDKKLQAAILAAWSKYDVRSKFWAIKWPEYEAIYELLTGEKLPAGYKEGIIAKIAASGGALDDDEGADTSDIVSSESAGTGEGADTRVPWPPVRESVTELELVVGSTVATFELEGQTITGTVSEVSDPDPDGDGPFTVTDENGQPYGLYTSMFTGDSPIGTLETPVEPEPQQVAPTQPPKKPILKMPVVITPPAPAIKQPTVAGKLATHGKPAGKLTKPSASATAKVKAKLAAMKNKR